MSLLLPQTQSSPGASERIPDDFSGWHELSPELWSYYSADAPSFVVEIDSTTDLLSVGMRVRLKQDSGVYKYFGINKVEIGATTLLTLYGGTDYTLANETITEVAVSNVKAPYGFPLDESKWSVVVTDSSNRTRSSPISLTWYNLHSSHHLDLPIGAWRVSYRAYAIGNATDFSEVFLTLSTSDNTASNSNYITGGAANGAGGGGIGYMLEKEPIFISNSVKTTYYLNMMSSLSLTSIGLYGVMFPTIIRAVWAYL